MAQVNLMGTMLTDAVEKAYGNMAKNKALWANSLWKHINDLENDFVGKVGEEFIQSLCDAAGVSASIDGLKAKEIGGGAGDGIINGRSVEIKCARMGTSSPSFQHELGECPWNADYLLFLDIAPEQFFISVIPNWSENDYKTEKKKWVPFFPTKSCCHRKGIGAFKFDTTLKINQKQSQVCEPHTYTWTPESSFEDLATFLNRIIPVPVVPKEAKLHVNLYGLTEKEKAQGYPEPDSDSGSDSESD